LHPIHLNQALLTAGGFNDARADRKAVDLIRLNPDGTVSKSKVKIDLAQGINEQNNHCYGKTTLL
jgi:polysaccharide export outer membrane protein